MKIIKKTYLILLVACLFTRCNDALDLQPLDRITADNLFSDPAGTQLYLADLYNRLPIEDFTFFPKDGFDFNSGDPNNGGFATAMLTDLAVHSERGDFVANGDFNWWDQGYDLIRDV